MSAALPGRVPRPAGHPPALPSRARVVIIGGGVIGTSVACHLAKAGCRDGRRERRRLGGEPVTAGFPASGGYQVNVAGQLHPASVSLRPRYGPAGHRVRGGWP